MQLGQVQAELTDDTDDQFGEQRAPVGVEEKVQGTADAVVGEEQRVAFLQAQQMRVVGRGPLGQGIQRPMAQHQVGDHDLDDGGGRQPHPHVGQCHVLVQQPRQPHPPGDLVDQRKSAQTAAGQREGNLRGAGVHRHLLDGSRDFHDSMSTVINGSQPVSQHRKGR
jgi:hypothetical protein